MYSFLCTATSTHSDKPLEAIRGTCKPVLAQPRGEEAYQFFVYHGATPVELSYRGSPEQVRKGDRFGVRKSADGKKIRLIFPDEETRVFTLTTEQAKSLSQGVKRGGK